MAAAFAAKVSGAVMGFLFSIMLARLLGPTGTGVYFLALTIVNIGATISRLGLDVAVLRFAAVADDQESMQGIQSGLTWKTGRFAVAGRQSQYR